VFVALGTQREKRMRYIIICGLYYIFFTLPNKRRDIREGVTEHKNVCFDFRYSICLKHFSF